FRSTPNRAWCKRRPSLRFVHLGDLNQGHVWLGLDRSHDRLMVLFEAPGALVAADPLGLGRSAFAPFLDKAHRARGRDPEPFCRRTARHPALNSPDNSDPQILRQRLGHACWPPCPARSVNQNSRPVGIPSDSNRSDFALTKSLPCSTRSRHTGRCSTIRFDSSMAYPQLSPFRTKRHWRGRCGRSTSLGTTLTASRSSQKT